VTFLAKIYNGIFVLVKFMTEVLSQDMVYIGALDSGKGTSVPQIPSQLDLV